MIAFPSSNRARACFALGLALGSSSLFVLAACSSDSSGSPTATPTNPDGSADTDANGIDGPNDGGLLDGDTAVPTDPVCDPDKKWGAPERLPALDTPDIASFAGATPDGLTVAWLTTAGDAFVTDRSSSSAGFNTPVFANELTAAFNLADDRLTVSWEGRSLVGVDEERHKFQIITRDNEGAWEMGDATQFATLEASIAGGDISSPVLGTSGKSLFFLLTSAGKIALHESRLDGGKWSASTPITAPELASADASHRRRPTGASMDDRTLFFFDETSGIERTAWRDGPSAAFTRFIDVGAFPEAVPLAQCDTIVFKGSDGSGAGIFIAR